MCGIFLFLHAERRPATHTPHQIPRRETMWFHLRENLRERTAAQRIFRRHKRVGSRSPCIRRNYAAEDTIKANGLLGESNKSPESKSVQNGYTTPKTLNRKPEKISTNAGWTPAPLTKRTQSSIYPTSISC